MPTAVKRKSPVKKRSFVRRKSPVKKRSPVRRKTSPKRRSPVKRKKSPKRRSPVRRKTSPKRKTSRKRLSAPPYGPYLNKQHFENAYAQYARNQRSRYQTPMTKTVYLKWVRDRYDQRIAADIQRARERRNVKEVMRRVKEAPFQRAVDEAESQRLRDIRNPPSQRELAARQEADLRVARSLPSVPKGKSGKK